MYIGDVVKAFLAGVEGKDTEGRIDQLCGPKRYQLLELVRLIARWSQRRRWILGLPDGLSRLVAALPGQFFTLDNYRSLQVPSVCGEDGLADLGIEATPLEPLAEQWLSPDQGRANRLDDWRRGR